MKKLLFIILAVAMVGCKKGDVVTPDNLSTIKAQIVGTWNGLRAETHYTDLAGKAQVDLSPYLYSYVINADGTAKKNYRILKTGATGTTFTCPYTIYSSNGKNYIKFLVTPTDDSDIYEIVSIIDGRIILNIVYGATAGNVIPGTYVTGTNAVYIEELYK